MPLAVITGASSGIGLACAERFLAAGWQVALLARRAEPMNALAGRHPGQALALPCDVTDDAGVEAAFDAAIGHFGRIDTLFANAGIFPPGATIDEINPADWRAAVEVNLTGVFLSTRAAFGRMRRQVPQGGRIILNGSIAAHSPRPGSAAYTATKHALTGLTKTLMLDGRPLGITCGQIDIGNARTDLIAAVEEGALQADGSVRAEPLMELRQVAEAVLHMASQPEGANIPFLTITASAMPWIGRG